MLHIQCISINMNNVWTNFDFLFRYSNIKLDVYVSLQAKINGYFCRYSLYHSFCITYQIREFTIKPYSLDWKKVNCAIFIMNEAELKVGLSYSDGN